MITVPLLTFVKLNRAILAEHRRTPRFAYARGVALPRILPG